MDTTAAIQIVQHAQGQQTVSVFLLLVSALLGATMHFIKKAKRLQNTAGAYFCIGDFFKKEVLSIFSSIVVIVAALICKENIAQLKIATMIAGGFMYPTFFGIGYFGDSVVDMIFGGYEKKLKDENKI